MPIPAFENIVLQLATADRRIDSPPVNPGASRFDDYSVVSLMDIIETSNDQTFGALSFIGGAVSEWRMLQQLEGVISIPALPRATCVGFLASVEQLKVAAQQLHLPSSVAIIEDGFEDALQQLSPDRPLSSYEFQSLISYAERVISVFRAEAKARRFFVLRPQHADFLSPAGPLFGDDVEDAFPRAAQEIADAGYCRAAGLWTASVMHLMRAVEEPLSSLAAWAGVDVGQNWNTALNQIDKHLREQTRSAHGAEAEQWASEASAHLRAIKNAWRNHAQHGQARYNEAEAIAIWNNVEFLMRSLAKKLGQPR